MLKKLSLVTMALLLTAGLAACGPGGSGGGSSGKKITFGVFSGPFLVNVGVHDGTFDNVDLKVVTIDSGPTALPLVASGRMAGIDELGAPPAAIAAATKVPIKIIWMDGNEISGLVADPNIKTAQDLRGKKIGVSVGSIEEFLLDKYLEANGVTPASVKVIDLTPDATTAAFKTHQIDAAMTWAPYWTQMKAAGGRVLTNTQDPDFVGVSSAFIAKNRRSVQTLVCDYAKVHGAFFKDPQSTYATLGKLMGEPVSAVTAVLPRSSVAPVDQTGADYLGGSGAAPSLPSFLFEVGKWMYANHKIPVLPKQAEYARMIDNSFAKYAAEGKCNG